MHTSDKICYRKPVFVFSAWLITALILGLIALCLGIKTVIPGPFSEQELLQNYGEVLAEKNSIPYKDAVVLILEDPDQSYPNKNLSIALNDLYNLLKNTETPLTKNKTETKKLFNKIQTAGHTMLGDNNFLSKDNKNILIIAETDLKIYLAPENLKDFPSILKDWNKKFPGYKLHFLSIGIFSNEMFQMIDSDLHYSLLYTMPLTAIILIWAFGSLVAAAVPIFIAIVSLVSSLGIASIYSNYFTAISATASQLVVLLVLAIGIDYSLFIISRIREEVRSGLTYETAIIKAFSSTGVAIFWSGVTVTISLFGLFLMDDTILTSMALVSIFAVIITLISCLTALPAFLMIIQEKIEWGSFFKRNKSKNEFLLRCLDISLDNPVIMLLCSVIFLLIFSSYALKLKFGSTVEPDLFPPSLLSAQASKKIDQHFPGYSGTDFSVLIEAQNLSILEEDGKLQDFVSNVTANDGHKVNGPIKTTWSESRKLLRYEFIASGSGNSLKNSQLIEKLYYQFIPDLEKNTGAKAYLSGTLPYIKNSIIKYSNKLFEVIALVLSLSFVFLLLAFRSIFVPLKALILNALSTASSFGVLVIVFQSNFIPQLNYGVIESFVPALLFAILFGLSMDYHVFLLSRIREYVLSGMETKEAVKKGISATSLTITSAALIMVSVFAVIATLQLPIMKELGVGLAIAVLLDATIIRLVLLPASMVLLGRWNWYLPKTLRWLPQVKFD